jgi:PHD/YefM family antitoxin component YafN of YafNO toxin-antitoxin module
MLDPKKVLSITQLKQKTAKAVQLAKESDEPVYIFKGSKPQAVLLNLEEYKILEDALEELWAIREFDKQKSEKPATSLDEYEKQRPGR